MGTGFAEKGEVGLEINIVFPPQASRAFLINNVGFGMVYKQSTGIHACVLG